jgi:hypothetical protein
MSDTGWVSPGTAGNNSSIGTVSWNNPDYIKVDDGSDSQSYLYNSNGDIVENSIKLIKGGSISGNDKSTGATLPPNNPTVVNYGGASDLWGNTLTAANVNSSDFGIGFSVKGNGVGDTSYYLTATNFGLTIPTGSTIDGVEVRVEQKNFNSFGIGGSVDYIQIKVYYTEGGTPTVGVKYPLPPFKRGGSGGTSPFEP